MSTVERFENSFIENPALAVVDYESKLVQNQRLYLRINLMDTFLTKSIYFAELLKIDPRMQSRAFRFNMYNVFCIMFNESTIKIFFDFSREATLAGLFKAMIFLLNNSIEKKYYPIKCTILEYIIYEILTFKFTKDFKKGWLELKSVLTGLFDESDFNEYFKQKDKTFLEETVKVVIH